MNAMNDKEINAIKRSSTLFFLLQILMGFGDVDGLILDFQRGLTVPPV